MDWTKLFFSPEGRIGRQAFWIGFLVLLGVNSLLGWTGIIFFVCLYSWVCISAKRFHDMGKSGWLTVIPIAACCAALFSIVPIALTAIFAGTSGADEGAVAAAVLTAVGGSLLVVLAAFALWLGFLIWQGVAPSDEGENRYGAPVRMAIV